MDRGALPFGGSNLAVAVKHAVRVRRAKWTFGAGLAPVRTLRGMNFGVCCGEFVAVATAAEGAWMLRMRDWGVGERACGLA